MYKMAAWVFIVFRLFVISFIVYQGFKSHRHQQPSSQQLWWLKAYATLLGLFEVMIVGLQVGTISRLYRKFQLMSKSLDEEV
jgi:hypothetical protein